MKIAKLPIIIICISIAVIASWIFLIVPDLKNNTEYFEQFLEAEGTTRVAESVGAELVEPIRYQPNARAEVLEENGNILTILTSLVEKDSSTNEIILDFKNINQVDRTTRKFIDVEDAYFHYPYNTQKKDYNIGISPGGNPYPTKFLKTDRLNDVDFYVFKLNIRLLALK